MIAFVILLLVVVLIVLQSFKRNTSHRLERMEAELVNLRQLLSQKETAVATPPEETVTTMPPPVTEQPRSRTKEYWKTGFEIVAGSPATSAEPAATEEPPAQMVAVTAVEDAPLPPGEADGCHENGTTQISTQTAFFFRAQS